MLLYYIFQNEKKTLAAKCSPSFSLEIKDQRAAIGESVKFICKFAGTPTPGNFFKYISVKEKRENSNNFHIFDKNTKTINKIEEITWYHNNKIIQKNENIKIDIDLERYESTFTIVSVSQENEGFYMCKAVNEISSNETRAKFSLCSTATTVTTETTKKIDTTSVKKTDTTKTKKVKKVVQRKTADSVAAKMHKTVIDIQPQTVEDVSIKGKSASSTTTTSSASAALTICKTTDVREEENIEVHEETEEIHVKIYKELLSEKDIEQFKIADEINEILEMIEADKFGTGEQPLRELATIGFLVQRGITISEITHLYNADSFPALKNPESQSALVQLVEREGHAQLISEVITEETVQDEQLLAATVGFRAFLRMIEQRHITIEEVITNFRHEDFIAQEWKLGEAKERSVELSEERSLTGSKEILSSG